MLKAPRFATEYASFLKKEIDQSSMDEKYKKDYKTLVDITILNYRLSLNTLDGTMESLLRTHHKIVEANRGLM